MTGGAPADADRMQNDRSIGQLLRDLASDATNLIHQEVLLARTEIEGNVQRSIAALVSMAAGALVAFAGVIILLGAVVDGLIEYGLQPWLADLIVGGTVAVIGFIIVRAGQSALSATSLTPERATANLRRDVDLLKEQVS